MDKKKILYISNIILIIIIITAAIILINIPTKIKNFKVAATCYSSSSGADRTYEFNYTVQNGKIFDCSEVKKVMGGDGNNYTTSSICTTEELNANSILFTSISAKDNLQDSYSSGPHGCNYQIYQIIRWLVTFV